MRARIWFDGRRLRVFDETGENILDDLDYEEQQRIYARALLRWKQIKKELDGMPLVYLEDYVNEE